MFQFCAIRPHGSRDGAGLLPDLAGPEVGDLLPDPGDGEWRHGLVIGGFTVTVDGTPVVGTRRRGWLLATGARLVFCVPSYISPGPVPLNGVFGVAARYAVQRRARGREADTVYAGQVRWEHLAEVVATRPANRRVWETDPDLLSVEATEAITDRWHPRRVRITLSTGVEAGDVHGLAGWLAQVAAGHRLAMGGTLDAPAREALAVLAAGASSPIVPDAEGGTTVSYSIPGAATALGPL